MKRTKYESNTPNSGMCAQQFDNMPVQMYPQMSGFPVNNNYMGVNGQDKLDGMPSGIPTSNELGQPYNYYEMQNSGNNGHQQLPAMNRNQHVANHQMMHLRQS